MKGIVLIALLVLASCASNKPTAPTQPTPPIVVTPPIVLPPVEGVTVLRAQIALMAATSNAAKINWANRGIAPKGYIKGMALTYARAYCEKNPITSSTVAGSSDKDALTHLNIKPSLRNTYALLIGLGMRESSGKHCVGRDTTASNTSATSAEAGLFQTSYDSSGADASLPGLLASWNKECYGGAFSEGVTCSAADWKSFGSGTGFKFQEMAKGCPAFAAEYAAITLRKLRRHYGPINRKEVQFKAEVVELLSDIEKLVDANISLCSAL